MRLRHLLHLRPAPEFETWLQRMGLMDARGRMPDLPPSSPSLQRLISASADNG
jgi:ethanolamine ammonia-lyase large subunit